MLARINVLQVSVWGCKPELVHSSTCSLPPSTRSMDQEAQNTLHSKDFPGQFNKNEEK